ncbi:hypothetical protein LV779_19125 [Streptomyces thinghirensis]|nr:hypothetical protein [Streptomyces thinghirensis]
MDGQNGYQMPSAMMPGAPEGDDMRLGIPITLTNSGDEPQRFDLVPGVLPGRRREGRRPEAALRHPGAAAQAQRGQRGTRRPLLRRGPPRAGDPPFLLTWTRDGDSRRMTVRMPGGTPEGHQHGS